MDQEMMKFKEELQELVYKGQNLLQKMQGGNIGMRVNTGQGGDYSGGNTGGNSIGMRQEPWPQQWMQQQGMQPPWMQGPQNYPQNGQNGQNGQNMMQGFDPRIFM